MPYTVEFLPSAARQFTSLPKIAQKHLTSRIDPLKEDPRPPGAQLLQGERRIWRLRAGDYRVLYQIDDEKFLVTVIKIGHRRDVYRRR